MSRTTVFAARRIVTQDPALPLATHVAVRSGRILAVGDLARMRAWGDFDLDERYRDLVLVPGFVEGHCHLKEGTMFRWPYLGWFDRRDPQGRTWPGLRSTQAVVERLSAVDALMSARDGAAPTPLFAWGFDPIYLAGQRMTVRELDQVGDGRRPIAILHANAHLMTINSAMLKLAGIDAQTEVDGIARFEDGQANGELAEPAALHMVLRHLGAVGLLVPLDDAAMRDFAAMAVASGVTTATDMVNRFTEGDLAVLQRQAADPTYPVRLVPAFQAFHGTHRAAEGADFVKSLLPTGNDKLHFGLVKMMLDGSIQGFSARLRWPRYFNGAPNGIWVTAPAQYEADFEAYHRAGLTIHTHTNGDEASEVAIAAIERVLARAPRLGHRHTLQHGQMIDRALFRRMAAVGLSANLFANHLWYWGDQHHGITLGPDRAQRLNACRSALHEGVRLAIHSDAPVTPLAPLFTMACAVNRVTPSGRVLGAAECLTPMEALHAVTLGPAHTLGLDGEVGSIECGKRADFAVLGDDPLSVAHGAIAQIAVHGTVLGGVPFFPQAWP